MFGLWSKKDDNSVTNIADLTNTESGITALGGVTSTAVKKPGDTAANQLSAGK